MSFESKKEEIKGKTNQTLGKATGDDKQELKGKVQEKASQVKEKADEVVDKAAEKINEKTNK